MGVDVEDIRIHVYKHLRIYVYMAGNKNTLKYSGTKFVPQTGWKEHKKKFNSIEHWVCGKSGVAATTTLIWSNT